MRTIFVVVVLLAVAVSGSAKETMDAASKVYFQAHRGGLHEAPDNSLAAFRYTWNLGGIPEVDVRTTQDGVIICLHDDTLKRTTDAPRDIRSTEVSELTFEEIRKWDAGAWFDKRFAGEKVPALEEVFAEMKGRPERQVYLDLKQLDLKQLADMIEEYGVIDQAIFCHNKQASCQDIRKHIPKLRTMRWIGGSPDDIKATFATTLASGFEGLDQVQLHLASTKKKGPVSYDIDPEYLRYALDQTGRAGVQLEVLPFRIDEASVQGLLDLGIRWYATDEPKRFTDYVAAWRTKQVFFQAHRGANREAPENTLAAFEHAWNQPGAVVEMDVRTTSDGVLICLHDSTLARTTDAPPGVAKLPIAEVPYAEVVNWNAAARARGDVAVQRVPKLTQVFELLQGRPDRQAYLDVKGADLTQLKALIDEYGLREQVIFVHGDVGMCAKLLDLFPGARTMTWCGGSPEDIQAKFARLAETDFHGLSQIQMHLQVKKRRPEITYVLDDAYLAESRKIAEDAGVDFQLRPMSFNRTSMRKLLDLGVRWFVADEPAAFAAAVKEAQTP